MIPPAAPPIDAPRPPDSPPPHRFPMVATIAPLVVSFVLFAVTRSAYTLVFAALGPVVAIASSTDAMLQRRRSRKREASRFSAETAGVASVIDAAHADERRMAGSSTPSARELLGNSDQVSGRWRRDVDRDIPLHFGTGAVPSSLDYRASLDSSSYSSGSQRSRSDEDTVRATLAGLVERARTLDGAPIRGAVERGIGIVGPSLLVEASARSMILQLAGTLSPADWSLTIPADSAAPWLGRLPHRVVETGDSGEVRFSTPGRSVSVVTARLVTALPGDLDTVLELRPDGTVLREATIIRPEFLGAAEAADCAAVLADLANRVGIRPLGGGAVPDCVDFSEVQDATRDGTAESIGLGAAVGVGPEGTVVLDLVADGPHAIVGGTTGSGKSELLLSWVLGIAAHRPPDVVTFLFVDFKGGASFGSLLDLPHSVGLLTDLDAEQPLRALASLAAELRYRERLLSLHELRSVDQALLPPFPRLVVVVDEYAALLENFPSLHSLFADIAARGRSLGVHLVLCTQRPTGVIRDGILANCPMRLSLRVTSPADSTAVVGTAAAAELPARPPGRAVLSLGGGAPAMFQVARSTPGDVRRVAERWADAPRPRAPWLPPLGTRVSPDEIGTDDSSHGIPFALTDLPDEQAQRPARYLPREHGSLLVVGGSASGKSGVLAALAAAAATTEVIQVANTLPCVWDALAEVLAGGVHAPRVLLFDDFDALLAGCPDGYQSALIDLASRALREGPAMGAWCVLATQRLGGVLHSLASLCGSTVVLRMPSRAEHVLAGGDPSTFVQSLPPGGGYWLGRRIQVALAPAPAIATPAAQSVMIDPASTPIVAVSANPERFASTLRELAPDRRVVLLAPIGLSDGADDLSVSRGGHPPIAVADPDAWQSRWAIFGGLQRESIVLFDGISLAELRALTRSRELPPPFAVGERALWAVTPDKVLSRARLN